MEVTMRITSADRPPGHNKMNSKWHKCMPSVSSTMTYTRVYIRKLVWLSSVWYCAILTLMLKTATGDTRCQMRLQLNAKLTCCTIYTMVPSDEGKCNSSRLTPTYLSPDSSCTKGGAMIKWATARAEMSARIETLNDQGSVKLCNNGNLRMSLTNSDKS